MPVQLIDARGCHASTRYRKQGGFQSGLSVALLAGTVNAACTGYRPVPVSRSATDLAPKPVPGTPFTELWTGHPGRGPSAPLAREDSVVFVGGSDRRVVSVDLRSGAIRWAIRLAGPLVAGILQDSDFVFAGTDLPDGKIYKLKSLSGSRVWSTAVRGITAPLAMMDGLLIAQSRPGQTYGLDPKTGNVRWRSRTGRGRATPVPGDSATVIITAFDSLFRLATRDGRVLLRTKAPGTLLSDWVATDTSLIGGSADSTVVAVRPRDFRLLWRVKLDAPVLVSPAVRGDTVFAVTRIGTLYRILTDSAARAEPIATLAWPVTGGPVWFGNLLLLGGADGVIRALDGTGAEAWRLTVGRPVEIPPFILDDGLLALGGRGDLHRYRP
ncbi:MAG: PQQ-binding-like beta-propeller repeat protein [Gemmatimonadales bacterium]